MEVGVPLPKVKLRKTRLGPSVGGDVSVVSSELIGELVRNGVLAGDIGNGILQRLSQPSDCAGVLSPQ
jgi:hypothetical protein